MQLSPEIFAEIAESITIVGQDQPRQDDRRTPRFKLNTQVVMTSWADPKRTFGVRVDDLSIGGLGILHNQRVSLDEQIVVHLPRRDNESLPVLCSVIYWEPIAENLFSIGAKFERVLDDAELSARAAEMADENAGILTRISNAFGLRRKTA
jgi:PilZ domain